MAVNAIQTRYRFRSDSSGVESTPTFGAAENTTWVPTPVQRGIPFRIRFEVQNTGTTSTGAQAWRLFCSRNGGSYAQVTASTQYVQTTDATAGASADNATLSTRRLTSDSGTFVNGQYDTSGATGNITMTAASVTELEFGLKLTSDAAYGDTYDFRVYRGTSTALNTYTATPRVTVNQYTLSLSLGTYTDIIANVISNETRAAAAAGSLGLTGIAITMSSSSLRGITAAQGSYGLTGGTATLSYASLRNLSAAQGNYVASGQAASLRRSYTLTAAQGSLGLNLANQISNETRAVAARGSIALTGNAATLTKSTHSVSLTMEQGGYGWVIASNVTGEVRASATRGQVSWSGSVAALSVTRRLTCALGLYSSNGPPSARDVSLAGGRGTLALTGQPLLFSRNTRSLTCAVGTYATSGPQSTRDLTLQINSSATSLTGQVIGLTRSKVLQAAQGTATLTGAAASLRAARRLTLGQGASALTGNVVAFRAARRLTCATGALAATGAAAGTAAGRRLAVAQGALALSGQAMNFGKNSAFSLFAAGGAVAMTGQVVGTSGQLRRTLSVTSSTQVQLRRNPNKVIALASTSSVLKSSSVSKNVAISSPSLVQVNRSLTRTLSILATSIVSVKKAVVKNLVVAASSLVAASAVTAGGVHQVTLNVLSVGTVSLHVVVNKAISVTSTGTVQVVKNVAKRIVLTSLSTLTAGLVANINTLTGAVKRARKYAGSSGYLLRGNVDMIIHDPIDVVCGDDWKFAGPQWDELGNPLNLVGASFNWKLDDLSGATNYVNVSSDTGAISIVDQATSVVLINVARSFTSGLTPGEYRDWLVATLGDGSIVTLSSGIIRATARPA